MEVLKSSQTILNYLDIKTITGYCLTIIVAIIGWSVAYWQFNKQYERNIKLSILHKKRELEIEVVKEIKQYIDEIHKRNAELSCYLLMLSEGLKVSLIDYGYKYSHWDEAPSKATEYVWNFNLAFSNLLFFFDHRQYAKKEIENQLKEIQVLKSLQSDKLEAFNQYLIEFYYNKYKPNKHDHNDLYEFTSSITEIRELIYRIGDGIENLSKHLQKIYLNDLFK